MERISRIKGGLFGSACGDSLERAIDSNNKKEEVKSFGFPKEHMEEDFFNVEPGEVTDATNMMLAVAKGILKNPSDPISDIGKCFMEWYLKEPQNMGITIRLALNEYDKSREWGKAAIKAHNLLGGMSAGNGSLMRCIPVALYYRDFEKMVQITKQQSQLTHFRKTAYDACVLFNTLVFKYLNGEEKMKAIYTILHDYPLYNNVLKMKLNELRPDGYVVNTLTCVLWNFINTNNFEDALYQALELCEDANTIGSVMGGLAGTYYGYEQIPKKLLKELKIDDDIDFIASKMCG